MAKGPKKSHPKQVDIAYPQENFVAQYEFNRRPSVRSPVQGTYEYEQLVQGALNESYRPIEARLVRGSPHGFGHSVGQRAGNLRLSGTPGAHRLGKRK